MDNLAEYTIKPISLEVNQIILDFLKIHFYNDEPLLNCLQLKNCNELDKWSIECISDGCSFKAVDLNDRIIGLILSNIIQRPDSTDEIVNEASHYHNQEFLKLISFVDYCGNQFKIFNAFSDAMKIIDVHILNVSKNYRGKGIGEKLINHTMDFAKTQQNIGLLVIGCTSFYSAKLCVRMGFKQCYKLAYKDYEVDGINPIVPAYPHTALRIFVKKLD